MKEQIYRQGDVLLRTVGSIPTTAKIIEPENGLVILAHGEQTGHHHSFAANEFVSLYGHENDGPRFIDVKRPSALVHQEHSPIELPVGVYEVIRQREYTPAAIVQVRD